MQAQLIPSIRSLLETTKKILLPWSKLKEDFAKEIGYKDFDAAERISKQILQAIDSFYNLFYYEAQKKALLDWRSDTRLKTVLLRLYKKRKVLDEDIKSLSLRSFMTNVDVAENQMRAIIKRAAELMYEGRDSQFYRKTAQSKQNTMHSGKKAAQSNIERLEEWKDFVDRYREKQREEEEEDRGEDIRGGGVLQGNAKEIEEGVTSLHSFTNPQNNFLLDKTKRKKYNLYNDFGYYIDKSLEGKLPEKQDWTGQDFVKGIDETTRKESLRDVEEKLKEKGEQDGRFRKLQVVGQTDRGSLGDEKDRPNTSLLNFGGEDKGGVIEENLQVNRRGYGGIDDSHRHVTVKERVGQVGVGVDLDGDPLIGNDSEQGIEDEGGFEWGGVIGDGIEGSGELVGESEGASGFGKGDRRVDGGGGRVREDGSQVEQVSETGLGIVTQETERRVLSGLTLDEDSASRRFEGISYIDVWGTGREDDYLSEDPLESKGRVNVPIDLSEFPELLLGEEKKVIGCDFAEYGDDRSVLLVRHGPHVVDVQRFSQRDPMEVCGLIMQAIEEHDPDELVLDCTGGLGAGVVARLRELELPDKLVITEVIFNAAPRSEELRAFNARAEMYLLLQERLLNGTVTIPRDLELVEDVAHIRYKIMSDGGTIMIVPKKEIKKELGRSPDSADAWALAYYDEPSLEVY